jgi:glucosamine--fructose-6-phosphate aminotransferase (isomerizing)
MCGIVGVIAREKAGRKAIECLKNLEYRGYDSWGIFVVNGERHHVKKSVGAIGEVDEVDVMEDGHVAIAHTRWATHGNVSEVNAHPHSCCNEEIFIVHNGIIENYREIREMLERRGHKIKSQTDSELVAHLIEEYLKMHGRMDVAMCEALKHVRGSYALVVARKGERRLYFARKDSPLCIGIDKEHVFVASDPVAFLDYTNKVIFIDDFEAGFVDENFNIHIFSLGDLKRVEKRVETLTWKREQAKKGGYKYFIEKEIFEQEESIKRACMQNSYDLNKAVEMIKNAFGIFLIGSGSSFYSSLASSYIFSKVSRLHVNVVDASEFSYHKHFLTDRTLIIAVSQSGETADVLHAVKEAKRERGSKVLAITNVVGSTLNRIADHTLFLNAGPEIAVVSTKTFTSQLTLLTLLAFTLVNKESECKNVIETAGKLAKRVIEDNRKVIDELVEELKTARYGFSIGRGVSHALALEAALKLKEITYIPFEGFSGGFLKHGTIALIEEGVPCIVFAPNDETYEEIISNACEVKSRGGVIIGVSYKNADVFDYFIKVPDIDYGSYILSIIPIQYLAYRLSVALGNNPDKPRNLAKSVTVK